MRSEVKLLRYHIKQANIEFYDKGNEDIKIDIAMLNQLEMLRESLDQLIGELGKLGDFYWDREGFKRAADGKIFLTKKSLLIMGIKDNI